MSDVNNMQSEGRGAKVAGSLLGSPWCHSSHGICMTREWDTHDLVSSTVYRKIIFVDNFILSNTASRYISNASTNEQLF